MRGGIRKRSKNSYQISISLGKNPETGYYDYHWETIKGTKKDAERRRAELINQITNGTYIPPHKTTVAEYLVRWLQDYAKPNLSPRGYERYSGIIKKDISPDLGHITLTQLKPEHIQKHYNHLRERGLSSGTIRYHHAVLHKALQTGIKWGLLYRNPTDGVEISRKNNTEMRIWNELEVNHFLNVSKSSPYYALFHTALYTGMRRSELLAIKWADVDFIFNQISVHQSLHHLKDGSYVLSQTKSVKGKRTIALSPSSVAVLQKHRVQQETISEAIGRKLTDNDFVFSSPEGKPLRPNTITRAWAMMAKKAGVQPIRLHDARHTHASLMLKQGVHPKVVQERLGHSSIQMTIDIYSHVSPGLQQAAVDGFDRMLNSEQTSPASAKNYCQIIANSENEDPKKGKISFENGHLEGDGSAYGIRTRDLRLERAVS